MCAERADTAFLREERNRYAAFAFAGADILLEIDGNGTVTFASGKCEEFLARPPARLENTPFLDLIGKPDQGKVRAALISLHAGERLIPHRIRVMAGGAMQTMILSGFRVEGDAQHTYVALADPDRDPRGLAPAECKPNDARIEELRAAIEHGRFDLVYQPIVDLNTGEPIHFEALVRFPSGEATLDMIGLAEDLGMIAALDLAIGRGILERLKKAAEKGNFPKIAINISGHSLQSREFADAFGTLLDRSGIPPDQLLIEVTETAEIGDRAFVGEVLSGLRRRGYRICLDDFGSGSAVFDYLHDFDIDFIKIDGELTQLALNDTRERSFLDAITRLSKQLGVTAIAERVERPRDVELLLDSGFEYGQGFYFAMPAPDFPEMG